MELTDSDSVPLLHIVGLPVGEALTFPGLVADRSMKLAASPDGFVGTEGMVEIKCPVSRTFYDPIPPYHVAQVVGQMGVCGRKWCDYVQWTPTGIHVTRFTHDPDDWVFCKELLERFYDSNTDHYLEKCREFKSLYGDI